MNRRLRRALLCLFACAPVLAGAADNGATARLNRQLRIAEQRYGTVGQSVEIARDGKPLFQATRGVRDLDSAKPIGNDDVFQVFSIAKLFASTLVMQLAENGRIDLDRPASDYLSDLPPAWKAISVRQFLNHTSGVAEYYSPAQMAGTARFPATLQAALAYAAAQPMQFASGSRSRYTQTNYVVLLHLLETQYGRPYPQIVRERILARLGLRHTYLGQVDPPARAAVPAYLGKDGRAQPMPAVAWPDYALGHSSLYMSRGDLSAFLRAVAAGKLVSKAALLTFWRPMTLPDGERGEFLTGWESGDSGRYRNVGHDGGTVVRARILFGASLDRDVYTVVYLTNGSAHDVWSRTLVDDLLGALSPRRFPAQALSERVAGFALAAQDAARTEAFVAALRADRSLDDAQRERALDNTAAALRESRGLEAALRVFALNTRLYPRSAKAWQRLADALQANGDADAAQAARQQQNALSDTQD